jgi:uncharacterized protein YbcI
MLVTNGTECGAKTLFVSMRTMVSLRTSTGGRSFPQMEPPEGAGERAGTPGATLATSVLARVSGEIAAAYRRAWGRGPVRTTAHWAGTDALLVLLDDGHTEAERTALAAGRGDQVLDGRRVLHAALEVELTALVERITGRSVRAVLGATRLGPDLSAEIFLFEDH